MEVTLDASLFLVMLLGLSFLFGLIGWLLWRRSKGTGDADDGAVCGKCGYSARGLPGLDCPECGSDLREVGIVLPEKKGPQAWVWILMGGFVGLALLMFFLEILLDAPSVAVPVAPAPMIKLVNPPPVQQQGAVENSERE